MNRTMAFLIFFSIVIGIYFLANLYVYVRGLQAIPAGSLLRPLYQWGFWIIAAFFVAGRVLEKLHISLASDLLIWAGSIWLAALLYFFLLVLFLDILRGLNHFLPFFPEWVTANMEKTRVLALVGGVIVVGGLVAGGYINARNPRVNTLEVHIPKKAGDMREITAVVMSDIHLGTLVGNGFFDRLVSKVNRLNPDIILLPGDILDEDLEPILRQNMGKTLRQLQAPLGVFAIMGNHEHIGGSANAHAYLSDHGLTVLRDSVVKINEGFYLVGREDRDKPRFSGQERASLEHLLEQVDMRYPVILMDHQPFYLEDAAALGVDLQLSGHTHHGQLWPLHLITNAMYTISRGYGKIGNMHAYVSNGVGTWGPPVRIGNRPEIVRLVIRFDP
jgi:uncharacterized protein